MRTLSAALVVALAAPAFGQDTWKFENYAVGNNAAGGGFDSSIGVMMPDIVKLLDGTYRMYYGASGTPGLPAGAMTCIRSAVSPDGLTWTVEGGFRLVGDKDGVNPDSDGIPANEGIVSGPRVVRLSDGTYRMYYQASTQGTSPPDFRVKSATSPNGVTWTREGTRVDISGSPGPGVFTLAGHCAVIRFSDTDYVILISANYETPNSQPSDLVIGTSTDGLNFVGFSVLYTNGHDPFVVKLGDGSGYRLFYGNLLARQRSAFSADGKNWPAAGSTSETILLNSSGSEVTEASTEAPGDRAALELGGVIWLFLNWGNPSKNLALMKLQSSTSGSGDGGGGGGCGMVGLEAVLLLGLARLVLRRRKGATRSPRQSQPHHAKSH